MSINTILCSIIMVIINDYIYLYINQIYYARMLILIILYLLFDIFRIHHDYLLVSQELEVLKRHDKYILEEIRYIGILIKNLEFSLNVIKIKSETIVSYCKKFNNRIICSSYNNV